MSSRKGRVFCVTGYTSTERAGVALTSTRLTSSKLSTGSLSSQCDSESNTSGYLSSSSLEASVEEKRLSPNEDKVFRVWSQWSQHLEGPGVTSGPKSSTPKQASEGIRLKKRVNNSLECGKSLLAIKKNFNTTGSKVNSVTDSEDSFWGIKTPRVQKSSSEGDIHTSDGATNKVCRQKQVPVHDAGSAINTTSGNKSSSSQFWRRRPYLTQSTSHEDLRVKPESTSSTTSSRTSSKTAVQKSMCNLNTNYSALPRYRVPVTETTESHVTKQLASQLSRTCADFADSGVPVDESMSEFLSNVDKNNLAGFLNFYDHVTSSSAYERARRNPKNYEAVLF